MSTDKPVPPAAPQKFSRILHEGKDCPECGGIHYGVNRCSYESAQPEPASTGAAADPKSAWADQRIAALEGERDKEKK